MFFLRQLTTRRTTAITTFLSRAAALLAVFALGATPAFGQQQLGVSSDLSSEILGQQLSAGGPDTEWNRVRASVKGSNFGMLIPNYDSSNSGTTSAIKVLGKRLWEEAFFSVGGSVGSLRDGGTIVGFEFDIFEGLDPDPDPAGGVASADIEGPDGAGTTVHLGTLYLYTKAQWTARLAQLAVANGGIPLAETLIWRGATLHATGSGLSMRLQGSNNTLYGAAHGADEVRLGSNNWVVRDELNHVGTYTQFGSGHQLGGVVASGFLASPSPLGSGAGYIAQAAAAGQSFGGDLVILNDGNGGAMSSDGTQLSGVVYASGDVTFDASYVTATLTVLAGGSVDVMGTNNVLTGAVDGLLLWSFSTDLSEAISLDMGNSVLKGSVFGPAIAVRVGGSGNLLTGQLSGSKVKTTGDGNVFSDGTE